LTVLLLATISTLLAYSSVRTFEFTSYDDDLYLTANDLVQRGVTAEGVVAAFTRPMAANWHPLTIISHMLDVELFGLDPGAHHLVNVGFHLANSLLLFWVLLKMTRELWPAAAVALLFAVHPLHVESVAWVAERKDVLSGFFAILTLWAYARYAARGRIIDYVLVLFLFTAGLLSKPMLVTLPVLLLLLDYWPLRRLPFSPEASEAFPRQTFRRIVLEKAPLLLLALGSSFATIVAQRQMGAIASLGYYTLSVRIANAVVSYVRYLAKTLWPFDLSFHYPHPGLWPWPIALAALIFLLIISCAVLRFGRRLPWLPVGWFWFLLSLVPVIGLVQVGSQAMADRYMYLPLIGLSIIAAWGLQHVLVDRADLRVALPATGLILVIALTLITRAQTQHWRTSETLYAHGLQLNWNNIPAHGLLARRLTERGDHMGAVRHYSEALRMLPPNEVLHCEGLHYSIGVALIEIGDIAKARDHLATSVQLNSTNTDARFHLGRCFSLLDDRNAAESNYLEVLKSEPDDYLTKILLGDLYLNEKKVDRALDLFSQAARQRPHSAEAQHVYGVALLKAGSVDAALLRFREAIKLDPSFAPAHRHFAQGLAMKGNPSDAIASYRKAIELRPNFPEALNDLAWLLATHFDASIRNGAEALKLAIEACDLSRYQQPVPLTTLAAAYAELGQFDQAARTAERALGVAANAKATGVKADKVLEAARRQEAYRDAPVPH
jgi:protein O-mannosyl-transferase